jgi:hypothetical protein
MKVEVSVGEAVDKLSILHLKKNKINDKEKLAEIAKEIGALSQCNDIINNNFFYYRQLMYVNEEIWDMTDTIKGMNVNENQQLFASISNKIFNFNQKRFRLKNLFNLLADSSLKEQKSYATAVCQIYIENKNCLFDKFAEINYLCVEYDKINFITPCLETGEIINNIYKHFITFDVNHAKSINISNFNISENLRHNFSFPPIKYVAGGLFGDFIHQLSVINEMFYNTGRKGILYLSNEGDAFSFGLENTYADTKEIVCSQPYIEKYELHSGQEIDINLSKWRYTQYLYKGNWNYVFKNTYGVDWGKHKWITCPINRNWSDKVLINTSDKRYASSDYDFNVIHEKYGDSVIFLSTTQDHSDFIHFYKKTGINLDVYYVKTFTELCSIINSCKLFVGTLSGPLSISHATDTRRIICDHITKDKAAIQHDADSHHIYGLDLFWSNAFLSIKDEICDYEKSLIETT